MLSAPKAGPAVCCHTSALFPEFGGFLSTWWLNNGLLWCNLVLDLKVVTAIKSHCSSLFPYQHKEERAWKTHPGLPSTLLGIASVAMCSVPACSIDPWSFIKQCLHPLVPAKCIPTKLVLHCWTNLASNCSHFAEVFPSRLVKHAPVKWSMPKSQLQRATMCRAWNAQPGFKLTSVTFPQSAF